MGTPPVKLHLLRNEGSENRSPGLHPSSHGLQPNSFKILQARPWGASTHRMNLMNVCSSLKLGRCDIAPVSFGIGTSHLPLPLSLLGCPLHDWSLFVLVACCDLVMRDLHVFELGFPMNLVLHGHPLL